MTLQQSPYLLSWPSTDYLIARMIDSMLYSDSFYRKTDQAVPADSTGISPDESAHCAIQNKR